MEEINSQARATCCNAPREDYDISQCCKHRWLTVNPVERLVKGGRPEMQVVTMFATHFTVEQCQALHVLSLMRVPKSC